MILVHAVYVVVQTGVEVVMAQNMERTTREGTELETLVGALGDAHQLNLDVAGVPAQTHAGQSLKRALHRVEEALSAVQESTGNITVASTEIATGNLDLSGRTEQTASSLQQTASSMEQLTGTVNQTADSARTANQLVSQRIGRCGARGARWCRRWWPRWTRSTWRAARSPTSSA